MNLVNLFQTSPGRVDVLSRVPGNGVAVIGSQVFPRVSTNGSGRIHNRSPQSQVPPTPLRPFPTATERRRTGTYPHRRRGRAAPWERLFEYAGQRGQLRAPAAEQDGTSGVGVHHLHRFPTVLAAFRAGDSGTRRPRRVAAPASLTRTHHRRSRPRTPKFRLGSRRQPLPIRCCQGMLSVYSCCEPDFREGETAP